jgi:hypothetical protein
VSAVKELVMWLKAEAALNEDSARHADHEDSVTLCDTYRQQAERFREAGAKLVEMEAALTAAFPLARTLNRYAEINDDMGRVVAGQAQTARDLYAILFRALHPAKDEVQ